MASKHAGWIGLGLIGLPMAARLAAAGWRVKGFDLNPQRLEMAAAKGMQAVGSAEAAAEGASLVFTSMPTDRAICGLFPDARIAMPSSVRRKRASATTNAAASTAMSASSASRLPLTAVPNRVALSGMPRNRRPTRSAAVITVSAEVREMLPPRMRKRLTE